MLLTNFKKYHVVNYSGDVKELCEAYYFNDYATLDECMLVYSRDTADGMTYNQLFDWCIKSNNSVTYINEILREYIAAGKYSNDEDIIYNVMTRAYEHDIYNDLCIYQDDILEYTVVCIICNYFNDHDDILSDNRIATASELLNNLLLDLIDDITPINDQCFTDLKIDCYDVIDEYIEELI